MAETHGQKIRGLRRAAKISLTDLSARIDKGASYISRCETGKCPMPLPLYYELRSEIYKLARERAEAALEVDE